MWIIYQTALSNRPFISPSPFQIRVSSRCQLCRRYSFNILRRWMYTCSYPTYVDVHTFRCGIKYNTCIHIYVCQCPRQLFQGTILPLVNKRHRKDICGTGSNGDFLLAATTYLIPRIQNLLTVETYELPFNSGTVNPPCISSSRREFCFNFRGSPRLLPSAANVALSCPHLQTPTPSIIVRMLTRKF